MRYSELSTYINCPVKYDFIYKEGLKEDATLDLVFGTCMHTALECSFEGLDAKEVFENEFLKYQDKELKRYTYSFDSLLSIGPKFLDNFESRHRKKFELLACEKSFRTSILDIEFTGTIDCIAYIDGVPTVVDFKTSDKAYKKDKIDSNLQMYLYAKAASEIFSIEIKQIMYLVFIKSEAPRIQTLKKELDQDLLQVHLNNACEISKLLLSGVRYKNFNSCNYCMFINKCWGNK